jgi:hypothetical protein
MINNERISFLNMAAYYQNQKNTKKAGCMLFLKRNLEFGRMIFLNKKRQ